VLDIKAKLVVQAEPSMETEEFPSRGTFSEASYPLQGGSGIGTFRESFALPACHHLLQHCLEI